MLLRRYAAIVAASVLVLVLAVSLTTVAFAKKNARARAGDKSPRASVTFLAPDTDTELAGKVSWRVRASGAGGVRSVRFIIDGKTVSTDTRSPYAFTAHAGGLDTTRLSDGVHTLRATVTTRSRATATTAYQVKVSNRPSRPAPPAHGKPDPVEPTPEEPTPEPSAPTGPTEPTEPTEPVPTEPTEPTGPTEPTPEEPPAAPAPLGIGGTWNMIFNDEFSGTEIDSTKWSTLRGGLVWPYGDPYNPPIEDAFYKRANSTVRDGNAVLTLKKEASNGYPYSSGVIHSGNHFSFKYGYVESRVKVPKCSGCWPAFWMLDTPVDDHWPPEIDIFEFFDSINDPHPYFNYHWADNGHKQLGIKQIGSPTTDYTQTYHTYGLMWTSSKVQVYLDGVPGPAFTDPRFITQARNYVIFNFALQKGKTPPTGQELLVDYVRVWQQG